MIESDDEFDYYPKENANSNYYGENNFEFNNEGCEKKNVQVEENMDKEENSNPSVVCFLMMNSILV